MSRVAYTDRGELVDAILAQRALVDRTADAVRSALRRVREMDDQLAIAKRHLADLERQWYANRFGPQP